VNHSLISSPGNGIVDRDNAIATDRNGIAASELSSVDRKPMLTLAILGLIPLNPPTLREGKA